MILYAVNLHSDVCHLFLNKIRKECIKVSILTNLPHPQPVPQTVLILPSGTALPLLLNRVASLGRKGANLTWK